MSGTSASSSKRTQQEFVARMGYLEKLVIPTKLVTVLVHTFSSFITSVFRDKDQRPSKFFQYFAYTGYRTLARLMTPGQLQVISKSTDDIYAGACIRHSVVPNSVVLEDGTKAHWIGSPSASKLLINLHGGGYVLPAGPAWMEFIFRVQKYLEKEGRDVSVLFLSYDLAPAKPYPRQLQQAAALLNHVVHVLHKEPQNIAIMGDSAGANLTMALLSHISHPHPGTCDNKPIPPVTLSGPLHAAILISPWIDFRLSTDSFKRNIYKDCIDIQGGQKWADAFMGQKKQGDKATYPNADYYNQAIAAPASWWEGVMVDEILIVAGKDEVLVDGILEFGETLKQVKSLKGNVTVLATEGEAHDQPNMDLAMAYQEDGEQASTVKSFLSSRL